MFNNTKTELALIQESLKSINHKIGNQQQSLQELHYLLFKDKDSVVLQLQELKNLPTAVEKQDELLDNLTHEVTNLKERASANNKFLGLVAASLISIILPNILNIINGTKATISPATTAAAAATVSKPGK